MVDLGYHQNDEELWESVKKDFTQTYVDTVLKELTVREFNCLEQKGDEIDDYIAKFNNYSGRLEYDRSSPLLVDKFCEGLNKGVHIEIMRQDIWPESLNQWQEAARRTVRCSTIRRERTGGRGNWGLSTRAAR